MAQSPDPLSAIFPIMLVEEGARHPFSFLGTGFLIDRRGTFLTAKHVFTEAGRPDGAGCHAVIGAGWSPTPYPMSEIRLCREFDVAVGRMEPIEEMVTLELADGDAPMSADILTVEYSQTRPVLMPDGRITIEFRRYFHKGHVLSYYEEEPCLGKHTRLLDLSFPALKGASGAPIIAWPLGFPLKVVGLIIGNVSRELVPAQLERVVERGQVIEEIKYVVPIGLALSWYHIRGFLQSLGIGGG